MRIFYLLIFSLTLTFFSCQKETLKPDPNKENKMEIGDDKIKSINEVVFQKSSFSSFGTMFILGEGLNYNKELFSIQGAGDYLQFNIGTTVGSNLPTGIYRFDQFFGQPFTINFGQLAEDYNNGSCFCTNISDVIMEVNHYEDDENISIELIAKNLTGKEITAYYYGPITFQFF